VNLVVYLGASTEDEGIEVEFEVRPVSIDNGADRSMPLTPLPANLSFLGSRRGFGRICGNVVERPVKEFDVGR
jgi:hypothetical protein